MKTWFSAGFLPITTKIRREDEKEFETIENRGTEKWIRELTVSEREEEKEKEEEEERGDEEDVFEIPSDFEEELEKTKKNEDHMHVEKKSVDEEGEVDR